MISFRLVAETARVLPKLRHPHNAIAGCIANSNSEQWELIHFFYSPASSVRLSDEDFREIFFNLTDAYPEEVDENPDLVLLISSLSQAESTTMNLATVSRIIERVLSKDQTNEGRALLLRPCFARITSTDLRILFRRLSVVSSLCKRIHIIKALSIANEFPFTQMRRACLITGFRQVAKLCSLRDYDALFEAQAPRVNQGLIIPTPITSTIESINFSKCYSCSPEGVFMTLHKSKESITLFDSAGHQFEQAVVDEDMFGWAVPFTALDDGIYLVEYAYGRDLEVMVIDSYNQTEQTFEQRRKAIPQMLVKPMEQHPFPSAAATAKSNDKAVLIWSAHALLSYENTKDEVVLVDKQENQCVFVVLGGVWGEVVENSGVSLSKWILGAVDGDDYLEVGIVEASVDTSKRLRSFCESSSAYEGEKVLMKSPVFVNVDVISAGWGEFGGYVQGEIVSVAENAGKGKVVRVEQLDFLSDGITDANLEW